MYFSHNYPLYDFPSKHNRTQTTAKRESAAAPQERARRLTRMRTIQPHVQNHHEPLGKS